jgi:hypothetical protein
MEHEPDDLPIEDPNATTLEVLTGRKRRPTQATLVSGPGMSGQMATAGRPDAGPMKTDTDKQKCAPALGHQSPTSDSGDDNRATLILDRVSMPARTLTREVNEVRVQSKGLYQAIAPNQNGVHLNELTFRSGATFHLLRRCARGWWWVCLQEDTHVQGFVPSAYLKTVA